ncbi:MAG: gamma-glutamylcyclotransferase [Deltaproteobacteria bacterium]|nr:gamma-glutamylcyclotransferase [Deltaproteobacteria bacterium]
MARRPRSQTRVKSGGQRPARLFVYGTLRDAERLAAVIGAASAWRQLGAATIRGRLYDLGPYPAARPGRNPSERVRGVVFEFADGAAALLPLDEYEETVATGLYARRRTRARLAAGRTLAAWFYVYRRPVRGLPRIASGDWSQRR